MPVCGHTRNWSSVHANLWIPSCRQVFLTTPFLLSSFFTLQEIAQISITGNNCKLCRHILSSCKSSPDPKLSSLKNPNLSANWEKNQKMSPKNSLFWNPWSFLSGLTTLLWAVWGAWNAKSIAHLKPHFGEHMKDTDLICNMGHF